MKTTRLTATAAAVAIALTCTASASADTEGAQRVDLPASAKIVNAPSKRLSLKAAARQQARSRRTGRFPAPPRLVVDRRQLERLDEHDHDAVEAPASAQPEATGDTRMFGNSSPYYAKRDPILNTIQRYNAVNVPRWGGTYNSPRLYEVQHGQSMTGCNAAVYNGVYCPGINSIGWSMTWTAQAWASSGDMQWATLLAHEYGHAAQGFLGIRGGWMGYTLYSEAFADCMAGGFLAYAHNNRFTDTLGRGDYNEFRDAFVKLASPTTQLNNHGTFEWRYASATYGWNTGFDGCVRWARSIDGV